MRVNRNWLIVAALSGAALLAVTGYGLTRPAPLDILSREMIAGLTISASCKHESGPPGPNDPYIECVGRKTTSAPWTAAGLAGPLTGQAFACKIAPLRIQTMTSQAYDVMKRTAPDEATYQNAASLFVQAHNNAEMLMLAGQGPRCRDVVEAFDAFEIQVKDAAPVR